MKKYLLCLLIIVLSCNPNKTVQENKSDMNKNLEYLQSKEKYNPEPINYINHWGNPKDLNK